MHYKVLYYDPKNLIGYAKWLNSQYKEGLELITVNGPYHIFIASQPENAADEESNLCLCPLHYGDCEYCKNGKCTSPLI